MALPAVLPNFDPDSLVISGIVSPTQGKKKGILINYFKEEPTINISTKNIAQLQPTD